MTFMNVVGPSDKVTELLSKFNLEPVDVFASEPDWADINVIVPDVGDFGDHFSGECESLGLKLELVSWQ